MRVKRCGKSAPATGVTRSARQTPSGARPNRERVVRPWILPGWPHRWMVTHPDPRKGPVDRTPPTGRLTVTHTDLWGQKEVEPGPATQPATAKANRADTAKAPPTACNGYSRSPRNRQAMATLTPGARAIRAVTTAAEPLR